MNMICYLKLMLQKKRQYILCLLLGVLQTYSIHAQEALSSQDALQQKKPYSVSVGIRQAYDDNIYTASDHEKSSWETGVQPSFLVNYPLDQTLLSARYTFDALYYWDRPGDAWDLSHEFVGRVNHAVSERFNLDARERFRYAQNPAVYDSASLLQRNGNYINNIASLQASFQWTPKFSTVTSYTNDLYRYEDEIEKQINNNMSNLVANDFRFLIDPTVTLIFGGAYDNVGYDNTNRSYDTYTGYTGADWFLSPQITISGRIGGQYFEAEDSSVTSTSPYGNLSLDWALGARSKLTVGYSHAVNQTDIATSYATESDTFTAKFDYQWTPRFNTFLQGIYAINDNSSDLTVPGSPLSNYTEYLSSITLGAGYKLNDWLSLNATYIYTNIADKEFRDREYTRNQIMFGVTGTY